MAHRLAAIDVGTNTALMVVADAKEDGSFTVVEDVERFVRLGEGVDRTGVVSRSALERLGTALTEHCRKAANLNAEIVALTGTSASRDALNRNDIRDFVRNRVGLPYEILTGKEEAEWSYRGTLTDEFPFRDGKTLVMDLGAGSTEFTMGTGQWGDILYSMSIDVGAVRVRERFLSSDPPTRFERKAAREFVVDRLHQAGLPDLDGVHIIGSNGTTVPLALIQSGADGAGYPVVPAIKLHRKAVSEWSDRLLSMTFGEILCLNPHLLTGRSDVYAAGVLILDIFMEMGDVRELFATPRGLRHGLLARHLREPSRRIR